MSYIVVGKRMYTLEQAGKRIKELEGKLNQRDFQDEVLEETGRLLDKSQAKVKELEGVLDELWEMKDATVIEMRNHIRTFSKKNEHATKEEADAT